MTNHAGFGLRCTASDGLGNRCVKDRSHSDAGLGAERWHDASRGETVRRWQ